MHEAAYEYVAAAVAKHGPFRRVAEFGSLDINGSIRDLFPDADCYHGIDRYAGAGVDEVADAADWDAPHPFDCVVCCEVFEHTPTWMLLIRSAHRALTQGGVLIVTTAGPGRGPHSGFDGNALHEGEWYANIQPDALEAVMAHYGFDVVDLDHLDLDVRAVGVKR